MEAIDMDTKKILVVSLHKCGTHLIENILSQVGLNAKLVGDGCSGCDFEQLKPNEYLLSHYPPALELCGLIETDKVRVVLNYRDPRDACVSRFHWHHPDNKKVTNLPREFMKKVHSNRFKNDEEFLESIIKGERFLKREMVFGNVFRMVRGLLFHPYVHKTRFEDLVGPKGGGSRETQVNSISKLLNFLGIDANVEIVAEKAFSEKSETFHRGQIGSYKKVFTPYITKIFNEWHEDILRDYGYETDNHEVGNCKVTHNVAGNHSKSLGEKEYSNLIDLKDFFRDVDDYVILKLPDSFPNYYDYDDIDILCRNRDEFLAYILRVGKAYEAQGFQIKIHPEKEHLHVDFYPPEARRLNFRFDLLDCLSYEKFLIIPQYSDVVLDSRQQIIRDGVDIYVPSLENDLAIRFLEYIEHKDNQPSKVKHLEYIKKINNFDFVEVVNRYTNLKITSDVKDGKTNLYVSQKNPEDTLTTDRSIKNNIKFYSLSLTCQIPGLNAIYEQHFGRRTDGCFVEVGAFDGEYASNTSGLADIGWTGYYIEPVLEYLQRCKARHSRNKNITVSQCAIGAESGEVQVHIGGPLSTIRDDMKRNFESLEWARGSFSKDKKIQAKQLKLDDYLLREGVKPNFELLVVDVEGYEWNVFRDFDIEKWCPQMVIVELHDQNDDYLLIREDCKNIVRYFDDHNYKAIYKDSTNTIYVLNASKVIKERMDYFLIWGHGLQYTREILEIIRSCKDLEIVYITRKSVGSIGKFVEDIYSCDTVPFKHLVAKTRYLLNTRPEMIFILVKNNNTQEKLFGEGSFRHVQCQLIKNIKEEIRNKFNPRVNCKRTEHHVIHASDYESQVEHVLKVLCLPPIEFYIREPNPDLNVPYHIEPFDDYLIKEVDIDSLYANILGVGPVPIKETPHYKYLTGDTSPYQIYYEKYFGEQLTEDHFPEAYDLMIANFKYDFTNKNGKRSLILAKMLDNNKYQILDGVHRAAVLKHRGNKVVTIAVPVKKTKHQVAKQNLVGLIFSKDRAMQLQATIESFLLHCQDEDTIDLVVLYKASNELHSGQYTELKKKFSGINFVEEINFREQVLSAIEKCDYILLLVDDNIFVKPFSIKDITKALQREKDAVGFSLRLGKNTKYCYPFSSQQALPQFKKFSKGILKYYWPDAEYDFGYPLEVSSSVYRCQDMLQLLSRKEFVNPNTLESLMNQNKNLYHSLPYLLTFEKSVTFANPVNTVQNVYENKHGTINNYTPEELADRFSHGMTVDVKQYIGLTPNAAHQEAELYLIGPSTSSTAKAEDAVEISGIKPLEQYPDSKPKFSIIMANYNNENYIAEAIESVLNQTFKDWELIVVEDCSTDNSVQIIKRYLNDKRIRLIQHDRNRGYIAALKTGIANVQSKYFGILDSDDYLVKSAVETMYSHHIESPDCGLIYSQFMYCNRDLEPKQIGYCKKIPAGKMNLDVNAVSHFKTFKLHDYLNTSGYDEGMLYAEDKDIIYKMEETTKPKFVDQCLYLYRELPNSLGHDPKKAFIGKQSMERARMAALKRRGQSCIALDYFLKAGEELKREKFGTAIEYMQQYRSMIDYSRFPRISNKTGKSGDIDVSVIIVTYNRTEDLKKCLESLSKQDDANFEVIVVDNGGSDFEVFQQYVDQYIKCPINLILSEGRNIGACCAKGKIIAFLDDDALVPSNYINSIKTAFKTYDIFGLRGKALTKNNPEANRDAEGYDRGDDAFPTFCDLEGNSAFLKEVFLSFEGMDPLLFGHEGFDLTYRIIKKYGVFNKIIYWPETVIYHDAAVGDYRKEKVERYKLLSKYLSLKHNANIFVFRNEIEKHCLPQRKQTSAEILHQGIEKSDKCLKMQKLGTEYGGWAVDLDLIPFGSTVVSAGVGEDISFDLGLINLKSCRVIGIDPTEKARRYIENNKNERFDFLQKALYSKSNKKIKIYKSNNPDWVSESLTPSHHTVTPSQFYEAETISVQDLLNKYENVSVLKMDIEGAEYEVLNSISKLDIPQICVEFHHFCTDFTTDDTEKCIEHLQRMGYVLAHSTSGGRVVKEATFIHQKYLSNRKTTEMNMGKAKSTAVASVMSQVTIPDEKPSDRYLRMRVIGTEQSGCAAELEERKYRELTNYNIAGEYRRIYLFHIRETGGTSLNHILLSQGGEDREEVYRRLSEDKNHRIISNDKVFVGWNKKLIEQGYYYYAFSQMLKHQFHLPEGTFTITCLRDPVKRVLSHYKMLLEFKVNNIVHPCMKIEGEWLGNSFNDFLTNIPTEHLLNQLYMFSKNFDVNEAFDNIVGCSHFFFTEQFSLGVSQLSSKLGIELKPLHIRKTSIDVNFSRVDIDRLRSMLEAEYVLFDKLKRVRLNLFDGYKVVST